MQNLLETMEQSELFKKIRKIEIKTRGLTRNIFAGEYKSSFKGMGMAFAEVREYQFGDDIRNIDWNVTARFNTPYVKIFNEERELTVILLIDVSGSQNFGTNQQTKRDLLTELSALLSFSAISNNDKIGVIFFSDKIEKFITPKKGTTHILRIIRELLEFQPKSKGTNIAQALEFTINAIKKRAIVFLMSDFQTDMNFEKPLSIIAQKHDTVLVKINDRHETLLPPLGIVEFLDPESGKIITVDVSSKKFIYEFEKKVAESSKTLEILSKKLSIDLIELHTGEDYIKPIHKFFKQREWRQKAG